MRRLIWLVLGMSMVSEVAVATMTCGPNSSDFACGEPCALSGTRWENCSTLPEAEREACREVWKSQVDARFDLTPDLGVRELRAIPEACRNRYESERLTVLELIASDVPRGQPCPLKSDPSRCEGDELDCRLYLSEQRLLMAAFSGAELRKVPERCRTDFMLEKMRTDRLHERNNDLRWVVPWASSGVCYAKAASADASSRIEKEKRDARRLGIAVNERIQRSHLDVIEAASDLETANRRMLTLARKPAVSCGDPLVKQITYCRSAEHGEEDVCQTPEMFYFTEIAAEVSRDEYPVVDYERVVQPLSVRSEPTGQEVWLDGEKVGITPLMLDEVVGGEHLLEIRGNPRGFEPWERTLIIHPDAPPDAVQAKLVRREAKPDAQPLSNTGQ